MPCRSRPRPYLWYCRNGPGGKKSPDHRDFSDCEDRQLYKHTKYFDNGHLHSKFRHSCLNTVKSYTKLCLSLVLGLPISNVTTPEVVILTLIATPDACFSSIAGIQLFVISRTTGNHKEPIDAQLDVEKTSCVSSQSHQSPDQPPQIRSNDTQHHDESLVDPEPEYVDSTCTDTNGTADASAVKDGYWKWDVDRQRFVHIDEKTGKETVCPEWFD
ncbi:hypothetical protein QC761_407111 [Podospora bellae-mahoneyi]|uniref:Uncharacterized protein n=1 Tax=Podospora bellae-mahoneyi TaxID=2093777 RepID=A0ABR0FHW3_9PEZI|nr:hypothetical protein QC761_407111 [Podospora bellae-mahoneyi]